MAVAPLLAGWWLKQGRQLPAPVRGGGNIDLVNDGSPLMVEILLKGAWVNVAAEGFVMYDNKVSISRGQASEGSQVSPGRCSFTMKNFEDQGYPWSSQNPNSPYYEEFGHGTRVRVSVPSGFDKSYRFHGEITNLEEDSDETGRLATVVVEASGILDRLGRGDEPLRSAFYREVTRPDASGVSPRARLPIAYWPMEDGPDSQYLAGVFTTEQMNFTAAHPGLATFTEFGCSDSIPNMSNSKWAAYVPPHTVDLTKHNAQTVWFLMSAATDFTIGTGIIRVVTKTHRWELVYVSAGNLRLRGLDYENTVIFDSTVPVTVIDTERWYGLNWRDDTSTTTVSLFSQAVEENAFTSHIEASTSIDNSPILNVQLNWASTATDFYIGHVAVFQHKTGDSVDCGSIYNPATDALNGFAGERADTRFDRLCKEEGITHEVLNPVVDTGFGIQGVGQKMGVQRPTSLLTLLQECEATDGGTLYELTGDFGLGYRTLESITNQSAVVTLSHGNHELSEQPTPKRDTNRVVNDATVQRDGGAQFQAIDTTTRMSINNYPAGVGRFNNQKTLSLYKDAQCADQAGWMKHLGTVSEPRYERIAVNFAHSTFVLNPTLRRSCLDVRPADRVDITDTPARLSYDDITQLAIGYSEEIDQFQHKIAWNSVPEKPYRVAMVGVEGFDRIDAEASHLMEDVSTTATRFKVDSLDGTRWIDTQDYASKFPFDIMVGGERMTVTGITGVGQDTFTRSATDTWGTSEVDSLSYFNIGGAATDYDVTGTKGTIVLTSVNVARKGVLQIAAPDTDQYVTFESSATSTGGPQYFMLLGRSDSEAAMYMLRISAEVGDTIIMSLRKRVASVETQLATYTTSLTFAANTQLRMRFRIDGTLLRGKVWPAAADAEPEAWMIRSTDTANDIARDTGPRSMLDSTNTNVNPVHSYDNYMCIAGQYFTVTRSVNGVVKAHTAGTEVHINDVVYLAL